DVNVLASETSLASQIKTFATAQWQLFVSRWYRYKKIDKASHQVDSDVDEITGLSIGRFFRRRYRSQNGLSFDETSPGVEVVGISTEMLLAFATALANEFHQPASLCKRHDTLPDVIAELVHPEHEFCGLNTGSRLSRFSAAVNRG
ncbi:MAG TPA: hypothetical protein VNF04_08130, partial [Stellaceae bacterium]|nr:hypothetical protein [Stellaceae bacterium]